DEPPLQLVVQLRVALPQVADDPGDLLAPLVLVPVEQTRAQHLVEQVRARLAVRRLPLVHARHWSASSRVPARVPRGQEAHPAPPRRTPRRVAARSAARGSPPCARGGGSGGGKTGTAARGAGKPGGSVRAESGDTWTRFDEADTGGARRPTSGAGARPSGVVSSPVSRGGGGGAGRLHPLR